MGLFLYSHCLPCAGGLSNAWWPGLWGNHIKALVLPSGRQQLGLRVFSTSCHVELIHSLAVSLRVPVRCQAPCWGLGGLSRGVRPQTYVVLPSGIWLIFCCLPLAHPLTIVFLPSPSSWTFCLTPLVLPSLRLFVQTGTFIYLVTWAL